MYNFVKTRLLPFFHIAFLLVACGSKPVVLTPTPTPTVNIIYGQIVDNSELISQTYDRQCQLVGYEGLAGFYPNIYYSPNREFSFALCEDYSNGKTYYPFIISRIMGEKSNEFSPIIFSPAWITKFSSVTYKPVIWNDGTLIFSAFVLPCPEYIFCVYQDGDALYEVDLETGEFSVLLSSQSTSYAFSISPDGKYLGYVYHGKPEAVYIRDLDSGKENQIALPETYERVGSFVWTPDSKEILFFGISYVNELFYSSLFLFDRVNSSLSILLNHHSGAYFLGDLSSNTSVYWHQPNVLYLGSFDSHHLYINIRTKEINQVSTSTP